jgi:hypothetical protein
MTIDQLQVADVLQVTGRGVVVVTNQVYLNITLRLRAGQKVTFHTPDGKVIDSVLENLELFGSPFNPNKPFAFVVGEGIAKSDLPIGTLITIRSCEREA